MSQKNEKEDLPSCPGNDDMLPENCAVITVGQKTNQEQRKEDAKLVMYLDRI